MEYTLRDGVTFHNGAPVTPEPGPDEKPFDAKTNNMHQKR